MAVERAEIVDIRELTEFRIAYLTEDQGGLDPAAEKTIREGLPEYYRAHLNKDLFCYVYRQDAGQTGRIVATAFLLVVEKPLSPSFISGKTGIVLNVYTLPEERHKGYAKALMKALMDGAREMKVSPVELKSTEDGYPLYKSLGFMDDQSKYHEMKWRPEEAE